MNMAIQKKSKTTPAEPEVTISELISCLFLLSLIILSYKKLLSEVLLDSLLIEDNMARLSPKALKSIAKDEFTDSVTTVFSKYTSRSLLLPMPKMASLLLI